MSREDELAEIERLRAQVALVEAEAEEAHQSAQGAATAAQHASDRAGAAAASARDAGAFLGNVESGAAALGERLDQIIEELNGTDPDPPPPPPPVKGNPGEDLGTYDLMPWPEQQPARGAEARHATNQASLDAVMAVANPGDVIYVRQWPAGEPLLLDSALNHRSGRPDQRITLDINRDLLMQPPKFWPNVRARNIDDLLVVGARSRGGDYGMRVQGCERVTGADMQADNTRHAKFVAQRSDQRESHDVLFIDVAGYGNQGGGDSGSDHNRSEGGYLGLGKAAPGGGYDQSSRLRMIRYHFGDLTEGVEVKPGVTGFELAFGTLERIHVDSDRVGPTGAIGVWFSGEGRGRTDQVSAAGSVHHQRLRDIRTSGHGALAIGFQGVNIYDIRGENISNALVRFRTLNGARSWNQRQVLTTVDRLFTSGPQAIAVATGWTDGQITVGSDIRTNQAAPLW